MIEMMRVGEVRFNRSGSSGNIFCIMGGASKILRHCGMKDRADEMVNRVTACGSYDEALEVIGEYVRLIEDDEML